jgi:hypothetical protein
MQTEDRVARVGKLITSGKFNESHRLALMTAPDGVFAAIASASLVVNEATTVQEAIADLPPKFKTQIEHALSAQAAIKANEDTEKTAIIDGLIKINSAVKPEELKTLSLNALRALTGTADYSAQGGGALPKMGTLKLNTGDMQMPSIDKK